MVRSAKPGVKAGYRVSGTADTYRQRYRKFWQIGPDCGKAEKFEDEYIVSMLVN
jgi:hypothetical protein